MTFSVRKGDGVVYAQTKIIESHFVEEKLRAGTDFTNNVIVCRIPFSLKLVT